MSEKRRGLGRGLGALIPTSPHEYGESHRERPSDVFFRDRSRDEQRDASPSSAGGDRLDPYRPSTGQVDGPEDDDATSRTGEQRSPASNPDDDSGQASIPPPMAGTPESGAADPDGHHVARRGHAHSQPDASEGADEGLRPVPGARYVEVPTHLIRPNPRQPRSVFDEDEMSELVDSIREVGLLQPVVVRPIGASPSGDGVPAAQYELVMGERRWRACQLAGSETVPAIVKETPDDDLLRDALLENLHRSQLNPLDEAAAYQQLLEDFGCTQESLAVKIGKSRSQISNTVRLLRLPPGVGRRVAAGVLSAGHARALLALDDVGAMERLAQRIVAEGLSVRSVEEIVAVNDDEIAPVSRRRREAPTPDERLERIAVRMSDRLDTRVIVAMGRRRGKLTVEFADAEDLDRILALLAETNASVGG